MNANSEYFPTDSEQQNQTPAKKAKTPYDLRRQVCLCNDAELRDFDKLLFCRITDMCFEDAFKRGDGVIACSKKFLSDDFDCSTDKVTRSTRRLEKSGFLWTQSIWTGAFEITWWFVRDWADDKKEYGRHTGSNYGRRHRGVQRNVQRGAAGKFAANPDSLRSKLRSAMDLLSNGHGATVNTATMKAGISPDHGEDSALTGPKATPGQGRTVSGGSRLESALTGPKATRGQGATVGPDRADPSALTRPKVTPGQGRRLPGLTSLQTSNGEEEEDSFKRSTVLNAKRSARTGKTPSRENTFLLDVRAAMDRWKKGEGEKELKNSGAWWRLGYRADADLMEKVLADTLSAVKESRIKKHPGAHAVDLWQRWGGTLPQEAAR